MNSSFYFKLVDEIASVRAPRELAALVDRVASATMHPVQRRVLERALQVRSEALDLADVVPFRTGHAQHPTEAHAASRPIAR